MLSIVSMKVKLCWLVVVVLNVVGRVVVTGILGVAAMFMIKMLVVVAAAAVVVIIVAVEIAVIVLIVVLRRIDIKKESSI